MSIDRSLRKRLIQLARSSRTRTAVWAPSRPTDWHPESVRNPKGILDEYFTESSAWEFVADHLESGCEVEIIELRKPPGKKANVMKIELSIDERALYIKLQLGRNEVIGRSFHYTYKIEK